MKVNAKAVIQSISEITTTENGAKWLSFRADTLEEYSQLIEVKIYKKQEYAEHAENFVKYNKVGDTVDLELSVSCREYNEKIFTNLNLWKCTKVETGTPAPAAPVAAEDDMPF
jgi:hypothetical protein